MRTDRAAVAILVLAVVCVSSGSILVRLADAPAVAIAFYRLAYAAAIHGLLSLASLKDYRAFDREMLLKSFIAGAALAVHFTLWISALEHTSVAAATVLGAFHPVFTALLAYWFLGERLGRRGFLCILLALVGTAVIAGGDFALGGGSLYGDALALVSALAIAFYFLGGRQVRARVATLPYTTVVYASAMLWVGLLSRVMSVPLAGYGAGEHGLFIALAVIPTLLGHTLLNWSLAHTQTFDVSASILGEPVGATLLAYLLLREAPGHHQVSGGVLILAGLMALMGRRNEPGVGEVPPRHSGR